MRSSAWWFWPAVVAVLASVLVTAHIVMGEGLPIPWNDETSFIVPALSFARGDGFDGRMMLAAGVYWMPPVIYIVNGAIIAAFGAGLGVVRAVSLAEILLCLPLIIQLTGKLGRSDIRVARAVLVAGWVLNVQIAVAANTARPEALSLLFDLAALLAVVRGRWWGGAGWAGLAVLTHPLLALPALAVVAGGAAGGEARFRPGGWEWAVLVIAVAVGGVEVARFAADHAAYLGQYALQVDRKTERGVSLPSVAALLTTVLVLATHALARREGLRLPVSSGGRLSWVFAGACLFVYTWGREMWYGPFLVTGLLCLALGVIDAGSGWTFGRWSLSRRSWLTWGSVAGFGVCICVGWGLALWGGGQSFKRQIGFASMSIWPGDIALMREERAFVSDRVNDHLGYAPDVVLLSPFLYTDILGRPDTDRFRTVAPFSTPDPGVVMTGIIDVESPDLGIGSTESWSQAVLAGYRCTGTLRLASPHARFTVVVTTLERLPRASAFQPCSSSAPVGGVPASPTQRQSR